MPAFAGITSLALCAVASIFYRAAILDHLAEPAANTPVGSLANKEYSLKDEKAAIAANLKK